jgi:ElaB/YqjD/DUF883 family membrane-anchored ribosome-binding protein
MAITDKQKIVVKPKTTAKPKVTVKPISSVKPNVTANKPKVAAKSKSQVSKAVAKAAPIAGKAQKKVTNEMNNFKEKAADTARVAANRGKERASEAVGGIGKLLRDSAGTIDDNVGKNYGDYARSAADAVDGFADKMSTKEVDDIIGDARDFVRKSPAVAIGAAAAIGFVLVRLLRSGRDDA